MECKECQCPKNLATAPMLMQLNPVHTFISYFSNIHFKIIVPGLPSPVFQSGFPTKIWYAFYVSGTEVAYIVHLYHVDIGKV